MPYIDGIRPFPNIIKSCIIDDEIILEVKSTKEISNEHIAQTINYMKLAESQIGIIANFQNKSLVHKRLVL